MPKLPVVSGRKLAAFFKRHGFIQDRQKGSYIILTKSGIARPLTIPDRKEVSIGVLNNNLKTAGISREELIAAMQSPKQKKKNKNK